MFSGPGKNYHTDREQAKKLGFPNIVVQGMMSTCFVSQVMQDSFGMGWIEGGKMSVKLTNVVWVDETLTAHARIREDYLRILRFFRFFVRVSLRIDGGPYFWTAVPTGRPR